MRPTSPKLRGLNNHHLRTYSRFLRRRFPLLVTILLTLWLFTLLISAPTWPPKLYVYPRGFLQLIQRNKLFTPRPTHEEIYAFEDALPQHNPDLPFPEGRRGRYVFFSSQIKKLGWNNVFNEVLMNAHLAYASDRAYVFQDYIWKDMYYPWHIPFITLDEQQRWPHTPLNALISGPAAGGPLPLGDTHPRSVSQRYFEQICPPSARRIIKTSFIKADPSNNPHYNDLPGDVIFARWAKLLRDAPESCVEIQPAPRTEDNFPQVFDLFLWGSDRILPLWNEFKDSPTSKLLGTSPLVNSVVEKNRYLFRGATWEQVTAMHVRRGDFKGACLELANWNSTFYSWNLLPELPDKFTPPPGGSWGENTPENIDFYLKRCLPDVDAIVRKAKNSKRDYEFDHRSGHTKLDVMYLLTNEGKESEWLNELKRKLEQDGWKRVIISGDLVLDTDQTDVAMAADMELARLAAVFIGNGWSSFTSNIVHRRLVDGKIPISTRFW